MTGPAQLLEVVAPDRAAVQARAATHRSRPRHDRPATNRRLGAKGAGRFRSDRRSRRQRGGHGSRQLEPQRVVDTAKREPRIRKSASCAHTSSPVSVDKAILSMHTRYMAVREGLLALLDDGPRNGYQLKIEFEAATGGVWPLNVGQVYTTLDRLQRDGFVTARRRLDEARSATSSPRPGREELGRVVAARSGRRSAAARRADAQGAVRHRARTDARARRSSPATAPRCSRSCRQRRRADARGAPTTSPRRWFADALVSAPRPICAGSISARRDSTHR